MVAIVGLGNVGSKYKNTRHNVGFMFIDNFPRLQGVLLFKPDTMMNGSGVFVKKISSYYKLNTDALYIVHDDLDLRLGEFKIQQGKGPKVHNGVNSVEDSLGAEDFWRVRIGIDNRGPENHKSGEDYVLEDFTPEEMEIIKPIISRASAELRHKI